MDTTTETTKLVVLLSLRNRRVEAHREGCSHVNLVHKQDVFGAFTVSTKAEFFERYHDEVDYDAPLDLMPDRVHFAPCLKNFT